MRRNCLVAIVFSIVVLIVGVGCESKPAAAEETEILKITVGQPTLLDPLKNMNSASVSASRTGVVAAFYPWAKLYRTSSDGGVTWGPPMDSPPQHGGGSTSGTLRDGGVIKFVVTGDKPMGEAESHVSPMVGEYKQGWFMRHSTFAWFNDDFTSYEVAPVQVYMPDAVTTKQTHLGVSTWPVFERGNIIQLDNGDLLAPMYGLFKGDTKSRVILSRSSDRGHTWRYHATVATGEKDPTPELPGQYNGPCEPSLEMLPNGQMICVFRTQFSHLPGEYRPMSVCWSNDLGKTWTKPVPTKPHLMNIAPKLIVLENGAVALEYGRPGFHVAFSLDNGHTWQDRISFSDLTDDHITGQFDMAKAGPNKLVAIGSDGQGLKVWPITVERVKVSPAHASLEGRVLDQQGNPIGGAKVELGPNRYTADSWVEAEELDQNKAARKEVEPPVLGYMSISKDKGYRLMQTDARGRFEFKGVKLAEYVLTVEAEDYAPQWRHIKVGPDPKSHSQSFALKAGKSVRGRVVDQTDQPVGGACVVLDRLHIHSDPEGFFHWAIEGSVPEEVTVKLYKRYHGKYVTGPWARGTFIDSDLFLLVEAYPLIKEKRLRLSQIESDPLVMQRTNVYSWGW